ncbi:hypothetical protein KGM_208273 [Danaus plexippus plexippus]|uniref:FLYWCH-type domain-containing protein n=1 Tax=Danaus plexippus plexippus TaxID=278856 RepID=A0A212EXT9_DANPL|nr:hypothetical protein KGM_208273 [Danaus plexippus plexippus]
MITTAHGKNWLVYDGYTFYFRYRMRVGQKWVCTNFPRCKAFLCVNDHYDVIDCLIDHSHFKRILQLCPDVRLIKISNKKHCGWNTMGIAFFPILSEDGSDMGSYHTPEMQGVWRLITLSNGKSQMLYHGYTYFKLYKTRNLMRWSCTNYPRCKAYLCADDELNIKITQNEHNHRNKRLHKTVDGTYFKI